MEHF